MELTNLLSQANLDAIKESIQVELLKRGFTAPIIEIKEIVGRNNHSHHIQLRTADFQTIPVIFKKLHVTSFGTSIEKRPRTHLRPDAEGEYISVWISVHYSYESFSGGSNGVELFNIWFNIFGDKFDDVKINAIR